MKILFCLFGSINSPHFEMELGLIEKHRDAGDEVFVVQCRGELRYCYSNLYAKDDYCQYCRDRFDYAVKFMELENDIIKLPRRGSEKFFDEVFENIDALKKYSFGNFCQLGLSVASIIIDISKDHYPDTAKYRGLINEFLCSTYASYEALATIVKQIAPDQAYIFNGRSLNYRAAVECMQNHEIPFATHERGSSHGKYMLFPNNICQNFAFARKVTSNLIGSEHVPRLKSIAHSYFDNRRNGKNTNWRSFTTKQTRNKLPEYFDKSKKNIVIFNSSIQEYVCIPDKKESYYLNDNLAVEEIVKSLMTSPEYIIYLRVHPHLKGKRNTQMAEIRALDEKQYPNLHIIYPDEAIDTYALLDVADKVISFGSTAGIEATYWGKPSILLGDSYYRTLDVAYEPETHEACISLIKSELQAKPQINAAACGYREATFGYVSEYYEYESPWTGKFMGRYLIPKKYIRRRLAYMYRKIKYILTDW